MELVSEISTLIAASIGHNTYLLTIYDLLRSQTLIIQIFLKAISKGNNLMPAVMEDRRTCKCISYQIFLIFFQI